MMTAAIEERSSGSPMTAEPAVKRSVDRKPADAGGHRREHVDLDHAPIDGNAGAERGLDVAADRVGVAAELRLR